LRLIGADFHPLNDLRGHFRPYILGVATGTALALSYWIRPTNLVLAFLAIALLSLRQRRAIPPVLSGMLGAHLIMIGLNLVLLGVALPPYFKGSRLELHDQYLQAVAGNLISPARGLFIFSPFLLGALLLLMPSRWRLLDRNMRSYTLISLAGVGAYLLAVSGFAESWWAGISYGPRFMSESVVLMAPLALAGIFGPRIISGRRPALGYCVALAAIAFSMVTHGSGAQINGVMCWGDRGRDNYPSRVWDWSDPQFLEGPDLLIHDGLSNSMNASCPKT
ncbi:MAG TPA: hypothetical protein VL068_09945, partial [Microthrixaceae bacterium]|nr:hypothetical protein [Microthrixaceae bacterium]